VLKTAFIIRTFDTQKNLHSGNTFPALSVYHKPYRQEQSGAKNDVLVATVSRKNADAADGTWCSTSNHKTHLATTILMK